MKQGALTCLVTLTRWAPGAPAPHQVWPPVAQVAGGGFDPARHRQRLSWQTAGAGLHPAASGSSKLLTTVCGHRKGGHYLLDTGH